MGKPVVPQFGVVTRRFLEAPELPSEATDAMIRRMSARVDALTASAIMGTTHGTVSTATTTTEPPITAAALAELAEQLKPPPVPEWLEQILELYLLMVEAATDAARNRLTRNDVWGFRLICPAHHRSLPQPTTFMGLPLRIETKRGLVEVVESPHTKFVALVPVFKKESPLARSVELRMERMPLFGLDTISTVADTEP